MKKTALIIFSAVVFLGGLFIFYQNRPVERKPSPVIKQAERQTNTKQNLEIKTDSQALVTITVTPIDISPQSKEWKFDVVMDTHSVDLGQDMATISILVDERGKEYKPLRWEGSSSGGHHREGTLIFEGIKSNIKSIELKISGIGGVIRNFSWELK